MGRRAVLVAVAVAGLVATGVSGAAADDQGRHGGVRLEVLSGPASLVSGGAARVRVTVPDRVPLSEARVSVNGDDVTGRFAADGQRDALEGVSQDLRLGESRVEARIRHDRDAITVVHHPVTGPMFSGPQQADFFCSTPQHLAGFGLAGPFLDANCSLAT